MDKEEILKKSQSDNATLDEREDHVLGESFGYGGIVVTVLCIIFSVFAALKGQRSYEYGAIIFGYMAAVGWHMYAVTKKKRFLSQGIGSSIAVVLSIIGYFLIG